MHVILQNFTAGGRPPNDGIRILHTVASLTSTMMTNLAVPLFSKVSVDPVPCHRNFCPTKNCPRIKIFRKFLSYGIKYFVLGHKFSENFCHKFSENFCPTQIKFVLPRIGQKFSGKFLKIFVLG